VNSRILVIGDSISDVYREFEYRKQCPDSLETPVGLLWRHETRPGGAANVAVNLSALAPIDCHIDLISALDVETARSVKYHSLNRVNLASSIFLDQEQSLRKERIIFSGWDDGNRDFVARLDNRTSIDPNNADYVRQSVKDYLTHCLPDLVVLSDYAGGVLTDALLKELDAVRDRLLVDTKKTDLSCFSGSLLVKLNSIEYQRVLLNDAMPESHFKYFVVTLGEMGARLIIRKGFGEQRLRFPHNALGSMAITADFKARDVEARDVCGCGDTFLAGIAAGLIRYSDPFEAVSFANAAAATVVVQPHTAIADLQKTLEMTGREV
jgi:D-beta-D-heptose 7-phosphate kinase / D-beta-D-heptose 1-phosphate adenosyltransferase